MRHYFVLFALFFALATTAQINESWYGHYSGELTITAVSGKTAQHHMELIFKPINDSVYNWTIIYGQDSTRDERNYQLIKKGNNIFDIDEQNSIVLSNNLIGNRFISVFEVQGNLIQVIYRFEKKRVYVTLTSSSARYETGNVENGDELNNEGIPIVYGYKTAVYQTAILKKQK